MLSVDLNCDLGESADADAYDIGRDLAILPYCTSINLACGFHAGDPHTLRQLVAASVKLGIAVGAHPGFADREHFGRRPLQLSPREIYDIVLYQLGAVNAFLVATGSRLHHVKPHGALYNIAAQDASVAEAICHAVNDFDRGLVVYGLSGSQLIVAAGKYGLKSASEVFADRSYQQDGSLTPRHREGALISGVAEAAAQVLDMVEKGYVTSVDGSQVAVKADTVCLHGDSANALSFARGIHEILQQHDVSIRQPTFAINGKG